MTDKERIEIKKWILTWEQAGLKLEEIKRRELLSYDYLQNMEILDEMLQCAYDNRQVRLTSGLIEQQRLFMKLLEMQVGKKQIDSK